MGHTTAPTATFAEMRDVMQQFSGTRRFRAASNDDRTAKGPA